MKRLIALLLLAASPLFAQTVSVSGHLITPQNAASSAGVSILFELTGDGGNQCRLSGSGILVPYSLSFTQAQLAAGVSLIPNSSIVCGTVTGSSRWRYTVKSAGIGTRQCAINITANTNLDSTACLNATAPPVTVSPTSSLYALLDGTNVGFTGPITGTSGAFTGNVSVGGTTSLKNLEGIRFAADFAVGSTTCGIAEAYAALPSSGGEIVLQQGNCSASGWPVTIQKPILLVGQGMGGTTDPGTNAAIIAGSSLTNTSTGNSFFVLSLGSTQSVEGITFRDFAMIGNKAVGGATAGDCVDLNGGTTAQQLRAISFENVQCNQPKGSGFVIQDNAFMLSFYNVHVDQAGSHCLVIKNGVNSGIPSQIHIFGSTFDLCGGNNASFNPGTADGINISGSTARTIDILSSTAADSNNGINVVAGATNTSIHVFSSDFESNTTCDISLNDGLVHRISSSTMFGGGTFGLHGVCTNMPVGAAAQQNQLFMDANWFGSHTSQDILIGANQKTGLILPQNSNIYTYSDLSGNVIREDLFSGGLELTAGGLGFFPASNGGSQLGGASFAWSNVFTFGLSVSELTAPSGAAGKDVCYGDSTAHAIECSYNNGTFFRVPQVIGSGTAAMTTAGIGTGACGTTVTVAATGVLTTDTINISHNAAVTIGNGGGLTLNWWPTAGNVNLNYCNSSAGTITPTAMTVNWSVTR